MNTEIVVIPAHDEHKRDRTIEALVIPDFPERKGFVAEADDNAGLVWKPSEKVTDQKLDLFAAKAKRMKIEEELGLEILLQNEHNIEESLIDLHNWSKEHRPQYWTRFEIFSFERLYYWHGKDLVKIKKNIPTKPMGEVLKYYLNWKRTNGVANWTYQKHKKREEEEF